MQQAHMEKLAKALMGNWQYFESFVWRSSSELAHPERWAIFHLYHRDSPPQEQAAAEQVIVAMRAFIKLEEPTCRIEHATHWAVGWTDGISVMVRDADGHLTDAFKKVCSFDFMKHNLSQLEDSIWGERLRKS